MIAHLIRRILSALSPVGARILNPGGVRSGEARCCAAAERGGRALPEPRGPLPCRIPLPSGPAPAGVPVGGAGSASLRLSPAQNRGVTPGGGRQRTPGLPRARRGARGRDRGVQGLPAGGGGGVGGHRSAAPPPLPAGFVPSQPNPTSSGRRSGRAAGPGTASAAARRLPARFGSAGKPGCVLSLFFSPPPNLF